jgi:hypothetical protein
MRTALVVLSLATAVGCSGGVRDMAPPPAPREEPAKSTAGSRPDSARKKGRPPTTPEEKIAEKDILGSAEVPNSVEWTRWGPNDTDGDGRTTVRVCYWAENSKGRPELRDRLVLVWQGQVQARAVNDRGDDWNVRPGKGAFAIALAKAALDGTVQLTKATNKKVP